MKQKFVKKFYPELDLKVFLCSSWMLAPELKELLKPDSNILHETSGLILLTKQA